MIVIREQVASPSPVIREDVVCRRCGYNLRGLPVDGKCPECGSEVELSLRSERLCEADPRWVRGLVRGMGFGRVSLLFLFLAEMARLSVWNPGMVMRSIAYYAAYGLGFAGLWLLSRRDPGDLGENRYGTARRCVRYTLLAVLIANLIQFIVLRFFPAGTSLELSVILVAGLAGLVVYVSQLHYLQVLCGRIPDARFRRLATFLKFAFGLTLGVQISSSLWTQVWVMKQSPPIHLRHSELLWASQWAMLWLVVLHYWFLGKLGRRLVTEADAAQERWEKGNPSDAAGAKGFILL